MPDDSLLFYGGLLAHAPALGARRCEQMLADYFDVPVEIEQFVGAWYPMDGDRNATWATREGYSEQLGLGAVVGDEIWDQQSRVRIRLGPLTLRAVPRFSAGRRRPTGSCAR